AARSIRARRPAAAAGADRDSLRSADVIRGEELARLPAAAAAARAAAVVVQTAAAAAAAADHFDDGVDKAVGRGVGAVRRKDLAGDGEAIATRIDGLPHTVRVNPAENLAVRGRGSIDVGEIV